MTLYLGRTAVNATLAVGGGNVDDVQVDGVSVVTNKVAEIDLNGKQDVISDLSTIRSGATAGATAVQPSDLATVATSGSYNDLSNKPTIPSEVTESTVSGWGFTKNTGTVTSVNNISPVNGNVTINIPDVEAFTATEVQTIWNGVS